MLDYTQTLSFSAIVRSVEPNATVNVIENSIKDWLKLSSVRLTLAKARELKKTFQ